MDHDSATTSLPVMEGARARALALPAIIQGGMGVAVSHGGLARAAARAGCLGVVSGTALDRVIAYRLQEGDRDGALRRVLAGFPLPAVAARVLARWFIPGGLDRPGAYRPVPMLDERADAAALELTVVAHYAEITLAKEGHAGPIGLNLLEKAQAPNLASLYGALLAGVDAVLMGAGIPREIPAALDRLAAHEEARLQIRVEGAAAGETAWFRFRPRELLGGTVLPPLTRPPFLAVISSDTLAQSLLRSTGGAIDGFVVEGHCAGGHNAPPRTHGPRSATGEPVYGPRDQPDLARMRGLDRPFWLAGGYGTPGGLARARALGAHGIQVGTAFALCVESGLDAAVRRRVLDCVRAGTACVATDGDASPTGFPFKIVALAGSLSDAAVRAGRARVCNLGYLRQAYRRDDGGIGWRCAAEPEAAYIAKGGEPTATAGRLCLCNALMASAGHALATGTGREPPLVTAGDGLPELRALIGTAGDPTVAEIVSRL